MSEKVVKKKKKKKKKSSKTKPRIEIEELPSDDVLVKPPFFGEPGDSRGVDRLRKKIRDRNRRSNASRQRKSRGGGKGMQGDLEDFRAELLFGMEEEERDRELILVERAVLSEAKNGNMRAALYILNNQKRKSWQPETTIIPGERVIPQFTELKIIATTEEPENGEGSDDDSRGSAGGNKEES